MAQHYIAPAFVVDPWPGRVRPSRRLFDILERDGQIVPLLVHEQDSEFVVANDYAQRERLAALIELDWPTILVETSWTDDDL